uniref:Uncharacterized protein n=1 Tax=Arundo donax TaxID=35708 RepID=A0A0A9AZV9_ARUDO
MFSFRVCCFSGASVNEQPSQSDISMTGSQLESFYSGFHLPSQRKIRRKCMFMPDNAPASMGASVSTDGSDSFMDQQALPNEPHLSHSDSSCHTPLLAAETHRKCKASMHLQRLSDFNVAGPSHISVCPPTHLHKSDKCKARAAHFPEYLWR